MHKFNPSLHQVKLQVVQTTRTRSFCYDLDISGGVRSSLTSGTTTGGARTTRTEGNISRSLSL